jgi:hypothetical protein
MELVQSRIGSLIVKHLKIVSEKELNVSEITGVIWE